MSELTPDLVAALKLNAPPMLDPDSIDVLASDPGSVRYAINVPDCALNYMGTMHGGYVSMLLETAAGMATYSYGLRNVAITCATNFIRGVGKQRLVVSAETTHKGRSTSVVHCVIESQEGKRVAESTFTMFLMGPMK